MILSPLPVTRPHGSCQPFTLTRPRLAALLLATTIVLFSTGCTFTATLDFKVHAPAIVHVLAPEATP